MLLPPEVRIPKAKAVILSGVEWVFLVVLWMAFVSQVSKAEFLIGVGVGFVGAVADGIVKAEGFGVFSPKAKWIALIAWEPWYIAKGSWVTLKAFFAALTGRRVHSRFVAKTYTGERGKDGRAAARRALATAYLTLPPNSVIVGIDPEKQEVLVHEIEPEPTSRLAEELGVQG